MSSPKETTNNKMTKMVIISGALRLVVEIVGAIKNSKTVIIKQISGESTNVNVGDKMLLDCRAVHLNVLEPTYLKHRIFHNTNIRSF